MNSKKRSKTPDFYELWIDGNIIHAHSAKYLRNVAMTRGGDWAVYAIFKARPISTGGNMKFNMAQLNMVKELALDGISKSIIAKKSGIGVAWVRKLIKINNWKWDGDKK